LKSDHYVVDLARLLTRNPKNLVQDFRAMFPTSKVIKLSKNYRSTGVLVKAAASLISHNQSLGDTSAASGAYTVKSMRLN
jgi:predicted transcriptional regulator